MCEPCDGSGMQRGALHLVDVDWPSLLEASASTLPGSQVDSQPPAFRLHNAKVERDPGIPCHAPKAVAPASRPPIFGTPAPPKRFSAAGRRQGPGVSRVPVRQPNHAKTDLSAQASPAEPGAGPLRGHCQPSPAQLGCSLAPGHPGHLARCCVLCAVSCIITGRQLRACVGLTVTDACARARGACVCRILVIGLWPTAPEPPERRH